MSLIKFTAFQADIALTLEFAIGKEKDESKIKSKIAGSICNELFEWVDLQKTLGLNGLKLSKPIQLKFEVSGIKFDTSTLKKEMSERLLLRNNPQGRKNYAVRFHKIFQFATKEVNDITVEQLFKQLDADIIAVSKLKKAA